MKVQVSLDDKLMDRVDAYAKSNYMSRSALISLATTEYLNHADVISVIKDIGLCMRKIADDDSVDDETLKELEDYERLCKVLCGM